MYTTLNTRHAMIPRAYSGFGDGASPALIDLPLAPVVDPVGVKNLGLALVTGANLEPVMQALTQRYFIQDNVSGTTTTGRVFLMGDKQMPPGTMVGPEMIAASVVQAAIAGGRVVMISRAPGPDGLFSLILSPTPEIIALGAGAGADGSSMFAILGDQPTALIMGAAAVRQGLTSTTSTKPALVSTRPTPVSSSMTSAQAIMAAQQGPLSTTKAGLVIGGILVVLGIGYLATRKSSGTGSYGAYTSNRYAANSGARIRSVQAGMTIEDSKGDRYEVLNSIPSRQYDDGGTDNRKAHHLVHELGGRYEMYDDEIMQKFTKAQ